MLRSETPNNTISCQDFVQDNFVNECRLSQELDSEGFVDDPSLYINYSPLSQHESDSECDTHSQNCEDNSGEFVSKSQTSQDSQNSDVTCDTKVHVNRYVANFQGCEASLQTPADKLDCDVGDDNANGCDSSERSSHNGHKKCSEISKIHRFVENNFVDLKSSICLHSCDSQTSVFPSMSIQNSEGNDLPGRDSQSSGYVKGCDTDTHTSTDDCVTAHASKSSEDYIVEAQVLSPVVKSVDPGGQPCEPDNIRLESDNSAFQSTNIKSSSGQLVSETSQDSTVVSVLKRGDIDDTIGKKSSPLSPEGTRLQVGVGADKVTKSSGGCVEEVSQDLNERITLGQTLLDNDTQNSVFSASSILAGNKCNHYSLETTDNVTVGRDSSQSKEHENDSELVDCSQSSAHRIQEKGVSSFESQSEQWTQDTFGTGCTFGGGSQVFSEDVGFVSDKQRERFGPDASPRGGIPDSLLKSGDLAPRKPMAMRGIDYSRNLIDSEGERLNSFVAESVVHTKLAGSKDAGPVDPNRFGIVELGEQDGIFQPLSSGKAFFHENCQFSNRSLHTSHPDGGTSQLESRLDVREQPHWQMSSQNLQPGMKSGKDHFEKLVDGEYNVLL
jgi:hypothetical protein